VWAARTHFSRTHTHTHRWQQQLALLLYQVWALVLWHEEADERTPAAGARSQKFSMS